MLGGRPPCAEAAVSGRNASASDAGYTGSSQSTLRSLSLCRRAGRCDPVLREGLRRDMAVETQYSDAELGRAAAERLVHDWPELHDLEERVSVEFAAAAVERLAELIERQPALFQ